MIISIKLLFNYLVYCLIIVLDQMIMKKQLFIFCLVVIGLKGFSQKLPEVQTASLAAPVNIRVDGKHIEWNDTYVAENKRTEILYSLANDDKNLYLIVKSTSSASANKIMLGGISFTINNQGKKREKDGFSITYPLVQRSARNMGGRNGGGQGGGNRFGGQAGQNRSQLSQEQRDSAQAVSRKTALAGVKEIKVSGFKDIADSLISIYNEYGIKAVATIDAKGAFVYELAVPLTVLNLSPDSGKEFVYQIKINGLSNSNVNIPGNNDRVVAGAGNSNGGGRRMGGESGNGASNYQDLMEATDFWGKYILQKK